MNVDFLYIAAGTGTVLGLTAACMATGALLAVMLLLFRARGGLLTWVYRVFVDVVRSVPPLVWIFIVFFGLPEFGVRLQPVPATYLSLSIIATAYLAEIYRAGYSALDVGQVEASKALSLTPIDTLTRIICPQVFRTSLPATTSYAVGLLKDTSMASIIGVSEITFRASMQTNRTGEAMVAFAFAGVLYIALSLLIAVVGRYAHTRTTPRSARRPSTRSAAYSGGR